MEPTFRHRLRIETAAGQPPPAMQFPMLVHGTSNSSATVFAAAFVQDAIRHDTATVVLSMRRDLVRAFQQDVGVQAPEQAGSEIDEPTMSAAETYLLTTLTFPSPDQLLVALRSLHGWEERLVVVLGAQTLTRGIWNVLKDAPHVLVVGNISSPSEFIQPSSFTTKIGFSPWPPEWNLHRPEMPSYIGINPDSNTVLTVAG